MEKNIAEDNNESEGDGASTTVALHASNDCSEGLDGLAKDIAELGVSVPGETKFRQCEHSNWDAVAANTTSTAAEENDRDADMIDDENSSNDEHERMPIVMIMSAMLSTTGDLEVAGFGDGLTIIDSAEDKGKSLAFVNKRSKCVAADFTVQLIATG